MNEIKKNQICEALIEGYSSEGLGVTHIDGRAVFVHGGIRGEQCRIRILKVLKNVAFARVEEILIPSSHRQKPACPYFLRCGGCAYFHMDYEEELYAKRQKVCDALQRIGGQRVDALPMIGSAQMLHYRNKAQFPISAAGEIGFYRARTHEVIPVEHCLIQSPQADAAAQAVRKWMAEHHVTGYDERTGAGTMRHLYIRTAQNGDALVCLLAAADRLPAEQALVEDLRSTIPQLTGAVLGVNRRHDNAILADRYRTLWGCDTLTDTLCGAQFRLSVPSFYQVNHNQAEVLYEKAADYAHLTGKETVLELYCGAGTITLLLAKRAGHIIGAEIVPEAIENAKENAVANGVENAEFFCGDAAAVAEHFAAQSLTPDVIVVDPPRKGLAEEVIAAAAAMGPTRIVYVSCDSATLARDVKRFAALGYPLEKACAVDLFPRTAHCECVALMTKVEK